MAKYEVLRERVLGGKSFAVPGDIVYSTIGWDYGLSADYSKYFGIQYISVTQNPDGSVPFYHSLI